MSAVDLQILAPLGLEASAVRRGVSGARIHRTGMGPVRARSWCESGVAGLEPTDPVVVAGLGGALDDLLRPGDVVVASRILSEDGSIAVDLPGAALLTGELAARGIPTHCAPIVSADRVVTGEDRARLRGMGARVVDMESAWLLDGLTGAAADRPVAVVRVVVDGPDHELVSPATVLRLKTARRRLTEIGPVLERWADTTMRRKVLLAGPRSFCAGVDRAIDIVERALDRFGPTVYVRRQIVHNTHVVRDLEERGAVFVQEVDDVPEGSRLVLAAHGVAPTVRAAAAARDLRVIDATCPLVAKVHVEARRFAARDFDVVLIGHDDHEEVEGTVGEAPDHIAVVASEVDVDRLEVRDPDKVAFLSQTTLAVDEVDDIVEHLRGRFPSVVGPRSDDICYATQNRQEAVRAIAPECDLVLVVGSANSSNSTRLVEVATRSGAAAHLVDGSADIRLEWLSGAATVGITAGASAPESKVAEVVSALGSLGIVTVEERSVREEDISFALPPEVR